MPHLRGYRSVVTANSSTCESISCAKLAAERGGTSQVTDSTGEAPVQARCIGDTAIIYASDYLNKLSGERIERECKRQLESGCRALVINFRDTELVNSIGVSILMGVIDAAQQSGARLIFSDVDDHTANLFEMVGRTGP